MYKDCPQELILFYKQKAYKYLLHDLIKCNSFIDFAHVNYIVN